MTLAPRCDVLVIGAGIHGAGVAQRAAAAGLSVRVLERKSVAGGTSSCSSKLIHGGLRYLESGQVRLVRESLHERTALLRLAPELVRLERFHIPVYPATRRRPWQLRTGLALYAVLAGFAHGASFGTVPRREWDRLDGLTTRGLQKVYWYHDARTDDAALTRAVMASAQRLGAELHVPAEFVDAELGENSVLARYAENGQLRECRARVLVNAAGPWATRVAGRISPGIEIPPVELVQGTHLHVPLELHHGNWYVESPRDGRAIFIMPWAPGEALVGTTELRFRAGAHTVTPTAGERHYLRQVLAHYFPAAAGIDRAAERAYAGLRVLPAGSGHAFHRSRETHFTLDRPARPRVVSIYGGKLTTFRATARAALERVAESLPERRAHADLDTLPITPAE